MSEAKHTRGPWSYETDDHGDRHIRSGNGESLQCDARYYPWVSANEADWHLIAAAPDLLQAAEQFLASCKDGNASDLLDYYQDIFAEAVKKAGGVS